MPTMILDPVRATLVDLRTRFLEQSKQHRSLYHVLTVASPSLQLRFTMQVNSGLFFGNAWLGTFICKSHLGDYLPSLGSYYFQREGQGPGHPLREMPGNADERIVSRENVLGEFRELARAAGRCLTDLPAEMKGLSLGVAEDPRLEALHTIHDRPGAGPSLEWIEADYWSIILHRLGWQAYGRRPGSLLAVRPSLWEWSEGGFEPAALDIERREDEMWGRIDENSIFVAEEQDERDLFLSCLPFDVFQGSAYAIDTILQMDRDDSSMRPRDAGHSVVASGSMVRTESTNADDSGSREPPVGKGGGRSPAEATHRAGQNAKSATEPRVRISQAETEIRVREHLKKHPDAKLREIIRKSGVSQGAAAKTSAWKAARANRKSRKRKSEVRTRPLTSDMLASLEDPNGSLSVQDVDEVLLRQFIEHMSEKERANFFASSEEDQRALLEIYADQVKNG